MALKQLNITVGATPTLIANNDAKVGKVRYYIVNTGGSHDMFLGDASVTSSTGYVIGKFQSTGINNRFQIDLFAGESLFATCSPGNTTTVTVLNAGS
jgi:hypothetical protein